MHKSEAMGFSVGHGVEYKHVWKICRKPLNLGRKRCSILHDFSSKDPSSGE
jgi:hypothetical protein